MDLPQGQPSMGRQCGLTEQGEGGWNKGKEVEIRVQKGFKISSEWICSTDRINIRTIDFLLHYIT